MMVSPDHDSGQQGQSELAAVRQREHKRCFVCDPDNTAGLGLRFQTCADGCVIAAFSCADVFHGYPYWLHGGVTSSLLDGAMTNCLFARGVVAVTAELSIRFMHPVVINRQAHVKAWVEKSYSPLHLLRAELVQDGKVLVTASSKFMEYSDEE
jgi:acyl-coenzyme A thioesterase PaaI-like protein